jgi:ketosteroid isomerase-like protein
MSNLAELKRAYSAWHETRGLDPKCWLDIFADDVWIRSLANEAPALSFAAERKSKAEAVAYFAGLAAHWSMIHWTAHTFVTEGDKIAVFATCAWKNKQTGKSVETPIAHLWEFEGGKAGSMIEIFDSARVLAAAAP